MDTDTGQTGEHVVVSPDGGATTTTDPGGTGTATGGTAGVTTVTGPKRFYGSASLDPVRAKLSFSEIVDEVIEHFTTQHTSSVKISVEIEVESESGFSEHVVRTVRENCGQL